MESSQQQLERPPDPLNSGRWVTLFKNLPPSHQRAVYTRVRARCVQHCLRTEWALPCGEELASCVLLERLEAVPASEEGVAALFSWGQSHDPALDRRVEYLANWATCRREILDRHLHRMMGLPDRPRKGSWSIAGAQQFTPPSEYDLAGSVFLDLARERFSGSRNRDVLDLLDLLEQQPELGLAALVDGSLPGPDKWRRLADLIVRYLSWEKARLYEAQRKLRAFKKELLAEARTLGFEADEEGLVRYLNQLNEDPGNADEAAE